MLRLDFSLNTAAGFTCAKTLFRERGINLSSSFYQPGDELKTERFPLADGEADAIRLDFVLDRICRDDEFLRVMKELYRIAAPNAEIKICSLTEQYLKALNLPFALREISASRLAVLDAANRQEGSENAVCNFRLKKREIGFSEEYLQKNAGREISAAQVNADIAANSGIVKYLHYTLTAVK